MYSDQFSSWKASSHRQCLNFSTMLRHKPLLQQHVPFEIQYFGADEDVKMKAWEHFKRPNRISFGSSVFDNTFVICTLNAKFNFPITSRVLQKPISLRPLNQSDPSTSSCYGSSNDLANVEACRILQTGSFQQTERTLRCFLCRSTLAVQTAVSLTRG